MNFDPIAFKLTETLSIGEAFKASDDELKVQLDRLGDDDAKWGLVHHLAGRFEKLAGRQDGLKLVVEKAYNREFALEELKQMTEETRSLTAEIKRVMDELEGLN